MARAAHLLTYAQTFAGGGVERAMLRLARGWIAAGRRVTIVIGDPAGPLAAELPAGADTIVLGDRRYRALAAAVPRAIAARRPDAVFCPGSHYTGIAAATRLRLGRATPPTIGKVSNALNRADHGRIVAAGHRAWLRLHPRFLDRVVAMTPATAAEAAAAMGLAAGAIAVIANPPALPGTAPHAPAALPPRYLLGVGRLAPQKRWDRLIAALPHIADPAIPLVILGEGGERERLARQAAALGVAHRLLMPGHAGDPFPAMAGAALVALVSDHEGVPGVLREALAVGTPVVATDSSPAVAEIVDRPALGSIVPRDDAAALVAAIDAWLAPGAARPAPMAPPGADSAARYLALFDALVSRA